MKYMLAPMEDITDPTFRKLCYKYGADLTFTEMVRLKGLARKNRCTWGRLALDDTPTIIQLIGNKEASLKRFFSMFSPTGGFKGFNLNLGCPSDEFTKLGLGAAMVKRISKTKKLVRIIKDNGYNVSIKMRLGANRFEKEKKVYLNLIDAVDAEFFIVHARHGKEHYDTKADWSIYPECIALGKKIIANGDIRTKEDVALLKEMGISGAMIGREAVKNPAIFGHLKGLEVPSKEKISEEYLASSQDDIPRYRKNVLKHLNS